MPGIAKLGDSCTGDSCFPPRVNIQGSADVFVNGVAVHRQGDAWAVHCCGNSCHDGTLVGGSGTVFVNGKAVGRIGDSISDGAASAVGSQNVFAGG